MRRSRRTAGRCAAFVLATAALALGLASCTSGDADDAQAIVPDESDPSVPAATTDDSLGSGELAAPISVFQLTVGTCFDDPAFSEDAAATIGETTAVQCFEPHDAEVYALVRYTEAADAEYPGEDEVQERADDQCFDRFEDFVGTPYPESRLDIATIWPTEASWEQGDRDGVCVVFDIANQKLEGTMDGAEV